MPKTFSPAEVLVEGIFRRGQVAIHPSGFRKIHWGDTSQFIDRVWDQEIARNPQLTNLPKHGILSWSLDDGSLNVGSCLTDYKSFMGSRSNAFIERFGLRASANSVVVSCGVVTSDQRLLVIERGATVDLPGKRDLLGGHVEPDVTDPFVTVDNKLRRELGLTPEEIRGMSAKCLGFLYQFIDTGHFTFMIQADVAVSSQVLVNRTNVDVARVIPASLDPRRSNFITDALPTKWDVVEPEARMTARLVFENLNGRLGRPRELIDSKKFFDKYEVTPHWGLREI